ncbi:unknown [Firmicutes bacterium CAG:449]|nr:unknown [Firmicutes bacterium CAG:449]
MIYRILVFILGAIFLSIGLSIMIIYLSLFSLGFSFEQYINYLFSNFTFYFIPIGFLLLCLSLFFDSKWKKFIENRKK